MGFKKIAVPALLVSAVLSFPLRGAAFAGPGPGLGEENGPKSRFSLGLSGAVSFPDMGDINGMIRNYSDAVSRIIDNGQGSSVAWKEVRSVAEMGLELRYALSGRFSLGLEGGYLRKRFPGTWSFDITVHEEMSNGVRNYDHEGEYRFDDAISVVPVLLSGYYSFRFGQAAFYVKGGLGAYFGRYALNETSSNSFLEKSDIYQDGTYVDSMIDSAQYARDGHGVFHSASLGLHAGIGVEWKIAAGVRLGAECLFRTVGQKNWNGLQKNRITASSTSGSLSEGLETTSSVSTQTLEKLRCYYEIIENQYLPNRRLNMKRLDGGGEYLGRAADISLDGLSLRLGIRIGL